MVPEVAARQSLGLGVDVAGGAAQVLVVERATNVLVGYEDYDCVLLFQALERPQQVVVSCFDITPRKLTEKKSYGAQAGSLDDC